MKKLCLFAALVTLSATSQAAGVRYLLVGDSTVAPISGWGPAFCKDVAAGVTCIDMAKGGRSSSSYRKDGTWATVLDQLRQNAKFKDTYVLIQFGHNDQPGKPGRSTDVTTEFPANIAGFVDEVKATGAKPVLVTPLSRRTYDRDGHIHTSLQPWADAMKAVAAAKNVPCLDLHADSIAALNRIGPDEANTLAMAPPPAKSSTATPVIASERNGEAALKFDTTHLGAKGAAFFAQIVESELTSAIPATQSTFATPSPR